MSYARVTVEVSRDDLSVIHGVGEVDGSWTDSLNQVHIWTSGISLVLETTDTHTLVRKTFHLDERVITGEMLVSAKFFKRIMYMSRSKDKIELTVDMAKNEISASVLGCTIKTTGDTDFNFPKTNHVYPSQKPDLNVIFTKSVLEKLLKSIPKDQYVRFGIIVDEPKSPILVTTGNDTGDMKDEEHLIMPCI